MSKNNYFLRTVTTQDSEEGANSSPRAKAVFVARGLSPTFEKLGMMSMDLLFPSTNNHKPLLLGPVLS